MEPLRNDFPSSFSRSDHLRLADKIPDTHDRRTNVVAGALWMVGITLALFFLPLLNGLVGGFVGGYKVGSMKRALAAAVLPAVVAAMGLWVIFTILGSPIFGILAGTALGAIIAMSEIGIFVGAAVGGYTAERNRD